MDRLADEVENAVAALATVDRNVTALAAGAAVFAAGEAGRPGRIGHRLHAHWGALLSARAREAADAAEHLAGVALSVRAVVRDYAETDESVARRLRREF